MSDPTKGDSGSTAPVASPPSKSLGGANQPQKATGKESRHPNSDTDGTKPTEPDAALALALQEQGITPSGTASGQAADPASYVKRDHGEKSPADRGDTALKPAKNSEAQTRPALMTSSGSIPDGNVPSSQGLVPVSATTTNPEEAADASEAQRASVIKQHKLIKSGLPELSDEEINRSSNAAIRAYAQDRGYDIGEGGTRVLRAKFKIAQSKDIAGTTESKE